MVLTDFAINTLVMLCVNLHLMAILQVIMVENSLDAIRYHLENVVHIPSFFGDRADNELLSTLARLRMLASAEDVRDGIIRYER